MKILFVHQGAELYGSDRTFEQSVRGYRNNHPEAHISVLLASHGPLQELLNQSVDELAVEPLFVLRKQLIKSGKLFNPVSLARAVRRARKRIAGFDAVYINTTVIIDYIVACRLSRVPSIVHVHELPSGLTRTILRAILGFSKAEVIYNSRATQNAFGFGTRTTHHVVYNGTVIENPIEPEISGPLKILMIGRFNSWKGQGLLVEALALAAERNGVKVEVKMAGGVYKDQYHFKEAVVSSVQQNNLRQVVEFVEFIPDPSELYRWSNLVVVPSLLPEPFGLVAIEAMGHKRAVIGASHGGLAEIIQDGNSGSLFTPGSKDALAEAILRYHEQPELLRSHGAAGYQRYLDCFHEDRYMKGITEVIERIKQAA